MKPLSTPPAVARARAGFSLLELVVVVAVLAVIGGAAVPVARKALDRAARRSTTEELDLLADATAAFFEDTGGLPPGIAALETDPDLPGWCGPYLRSSGRDRRTGLSLAEVDGWGTAYRLRREGPSRLVLVSAGPGRRIGDEDDVERTVDVTPVRRALTRERLRTLNAAIERYNAQHFERDPLPVDFEALLGRLVASGYLPDDEPWRTDGFGRPFRADPPNREPVLRVGSSSLDD